MSLKIFILQQTGRLKPVEKLEAARAATEKNYQSFLSAEASQKLAEYLELEKWVDSGAVQQKKKELEKEVFKGSAEYNQLKEFETLKKNRALVRYFKVEGTSGLEKFTRIKGSELLKEYYDLKDFVEGGSYRQEKKDLEDQKFDGSVEKRHLQELERLKKHKALKAYLKLHNSSEIKRHQAFLESAKLHRYLEIKNLPSVDKAIKKEFSRLGKDPEIRRYFRLENSKELKFYKEMCGSHIPDRYHELVQLIGSREFTDRIAWLKDRKKFEKSDTHRKYTRYKSLCSNPDIKYYLKFEKSVLYANYLDTRESFTLKRYNELLEITTSPEYLRRKAWLEDTRKWEKSEEHARYEHYLELKKDPQVETYFKYLNSPDFDFLKTWEISFADDFQSRHTFTEKWTANTYWADKLLGDNYSQPGDLQAYTGGKNCSIEHGKLHLSVKKENVRSKSWQPGIGFVPADFNYSSDTLSTIKSFWQEEGIYEAKIMFSPVREIVSSLYLQGEHASPLLSLLEMGPRCRMGLLTMNGDGKPQFSGLHIDRLKKNRFYLFRLEWEKNRMVWKINDRVVHEETFDGIGGPAHINITSLVVRDLSASHLPAVFEIDWIKCYRKR